MRSYSRLSNIQSKKFDNVRKKKKVYLASLIVLNLCLLVFCMHRFFGLDYFDIKSITINGANDVIVSAIQNKSAQILNGSFFGLISKNNIFAYPKSKLISAIGEVSPDIQGINIYSQNRNSLVIDIVQKKPAAVVCTSLPDSDNGEDFDDCYFADWSGLLFARAGTTTDKIHFYYIPSLNDATSSRENIIGLYATSTNDFIALDKFYKNVEDNGFEPKYILINDNGEFEMYADDTIIYFNKDKSLDEQLDNLISFWNHAKSKNPNAKFEYIKLQYSPNIFYIEK